MKFILICVATLVSVALAAPLSSDTKPVEKSELHEAAVKDSESGFVKPVPLAAAVPSVHGLSEVSHDEHKPSSHAKSHEESKSADEHNVDKPVAAVSPLRPVRSNAEKPSPVKQNVAPSNTNQSPASKPHSSAPVHSSPAASHNLKDAPQVHSAAQKTPSKEAPKPVSTGTVPVQKNSAPQKDAASQPISNVNNNRQPQPVRAN